MFGTAPALLIVDLVNAYVDPAAQLYANSGGVLPATEQVLDAARSAGLPVIYTTLEYQDDGRDGGMFYRKVPALRAFRRNSPSGVFPESIRPVEGETVIVKKYPSSFFGVPLAPMLHTLGVDTTLICGFSTSGCVRATALDALQNGFAPFVVSDACGDVSPAAHTANLTDIQAKIGEVIASAEAITLIRSSRR